MDVDPAEHIVVHYANAADEHERLSSSALGRLEFERTLTLLRRHLPAPPAAVLDVGGGTGVYAARLMAAGYQTRLYDLVPSHVAAAAVALPDVPCAVADARHLPEPDASSDAVVLLGPLYHLLEHEERVEALTEAFRVTRPGGTLLAAAIGRTPTSCHWPWTVASTTFMSRAFAALSSPATTPSHPDSPLRTCTPSPS